MSRIDAAMTVRRDPVLFRIEHAVVVALDDIAVVATPPTFPETFPEKVDVPVIARAPPTERSEENEPAVQFVVTSAAAPKVGAATFGVGFNAMKPSTKRIAASKPVMILFIVCL